MPAGLRLPDRFYQLIGAKASGALFTLIGNSAVLTVGETDNFAARGRNYQFQDRRRERSLSNQHGGGAEAAASISAKLLSLAEIVEK